MVVIALEYIIKISSQKSRKKIPELPEFTHIYRTFFKSKFHTFNIFYSNYDHL